MPEMLKVTLFKPKRSSHSFWVICIILQFQSTATENYRIDTIDKIDTINIISCINQYKEN